MIREEPTIRVGLFEGRERIDGRFHGQWRIQGCIVQPSDFHAFPEGGRVVMDVEGRRFTVPSGQPGLDCRPAEGTAFSLEAVTIGRDFHWERRETQTFAGALDIAIGDDGRLMAVNILPLEDYLTSVVSSEMSAEAPLSFLSAHAIASRSWLMAMLEGISPRAPRSASGCMEKGKDWEVIRWYGREEHRHYAVCADDHCQRYQGLTRMKGGKAIQAVRNSRGVFLVYDGAVCDARYAKACGGRTEPFDRVWEDRPVPYLVSVSDAPHPLAPVCSEEQARTWILSRPDCYCNVADTTILRGVLPDFDRETTDFFRWEIAYERQALETILKTKSGIDVGGLKALEPLERGPSGRIVRLRVVGSKASIVVGKELEIRRWLSPSHLLSSAFVVDAVGENHGLPYRFVLHGAGWGHGVGMCQIGAAMMALRGHSAEEILRHYFPVAGLRRLYA